MIKNYTQFVNESSNNIFYHGSDNPNIDSFKIDDTKFSLLGSGVYSYKNKQSAKNYGDFLYKINTAGLRIAPLGFKFDMDNTEGFMNQLKIGDKFYEKKYPIGVFNPVWWGTDGWNYFGLRRKDVVEKLKDFMTISLGYDGYIVNYPNGGIVCVLWNHSKIKPVKVD